MNIEIHIDQLVLEGVEVRDRSRLRAAVEAELTRLLAEGGLPPGLAQGAAPAASRLDSSHFIPGLEGGAINLPPGLPDGAAGRRIAGAVYGGLKR
jgi:hypothetical protein